MKKIIILLVILFPLALSAQVPGYQGKRLSLGYEGDISLALLQLNSSYHAGLNGSFLGYYDNGYSYDPNYDAQKEKLAYSKTLAFNMNHNVSLDYVLNRRSSLLANVYFFRSGIRPDDYSYSVDSGFYVVTKTYVGTPAKISGFGLSVGYKMFSTKLAPLGVYMSYLIGMRHASAGMPSEPYPSKATKQVGVTGFKFAYMLGKQNVAYNKLVIDRGVSVDMISFFNYFTSERLRESGYITHAPEEFYSKELKHRVSLRDGVAFYFSVRYLLK